jgi:acetyl-CoA acetyltransferase family protein
MAQEFGIARQDQDRLALISDQNSDAARRDGVLGGQISPIRGVSEDNLIRGDTSLERLTALKPVFDRARGTITAGNSSALTDGASAVCLMADGLARENGLVVRGVIEGIEYSSLPPGDGLLMAPGLALPRLLRRLGWSLESVDFFEVHEAFAAQVLCNLRVWEHGWSRYPGDAAIGRIPQDKLNVFGGSMALGHPFAATGGRMLLNICDILKLKRGRRGVISVCAAGGAAAAVAVSAAE